MTIYFLNSKINELQLGKTYLLTRAPAKTQISWRIHTAWSVSSLSAPKKTVQIWLSKLCPVKIVIRQRTSVGWSESELGLHVLRYAFCGYGSTEVYNWNTEQSLPAGHMWTATALMEVYASPCKSMPFQSICHLSKLMSHPLLIFRQITWSRLLI